MACEPYYDEQYEGLKYPDKEWFKFKSPRSKIIQLNRVIEVCQIVLDGDELLEALCNWDCDGCICKRLFVDDGYSFCNYVCNLESFPDYDIQDYSIALCVKKIAESEIERLKIVEVEEKDISDNDRFMAYMKAFCS